MKGILGRKLGMTQVFTKSGKLIPVTVISVEPNVVSQIKTTETDGYDAIQLAFETKREKLSNKPEMGHLRTLTVTIQNLEIVSVDVENNIILVKGNVPGAKNSLVTIKTAVKNPEKVNESEELNSYVKETPVETANETTEEPVEETVSE